MKDNLIRAIDLAVADWDEAHRIVQQYEDNPMAAWIHAVLHKIEGDLSNARYWYRHAGKMECVDDEPMAELATAKAELME